MKNHAAAIGGQAFDGCGEFMAGEWDSLKCAACGCHRNFYRRKRSPENLPPAPPPASVTLLPPSSQHIPLRSGTGDVCDWEAVPHEVYYVTKGEDADLAEKLGWRIQKHDCEALEKFCVLIGVKRHVLKIWMHNHKNNLSASGVFAPPRSASDGTNSGDLLQMKCREFNPNTFHSDPAPEMFAIVKRYRTKFTTERRRASSRKKLGWRIHKHDCEALEEFWLQIGPKELPYVSTAGISRRRNAFRRRRRR